ncbi:Hsp20/alpha crystallin family protein [Candidatus Bathyarchaeota archaeon]|nr:Hsp20/alpha crystallin family protein [Candidatus Bathyarchaeota archaeon]
MLERLQEKRKYYKEIELPEKVDPKKAKSTYKNGVLEVRLPKKKVEAPKGEPIEIE